MSVPPPSDSAPSQHVEANAVSVKIPAFWTDKPEMWFYQVEAQFHLSGITSEETKFNYLIAQLEPRFVENIWDIIKDTSKNKYALAKERLINAFEESANKRIKLLISDLELGDGTPSQLLRKMRTLAGSEFSEKVIRTLWLQKMPNSVQNVLVVSEESLEKLSTMADKIIEMKPEISNLAAVQKSSNVDELLAKIAALELQVATLSDQRNSRNQKRYYQQNRSRSRSRKRYDPKGKLCFYHFRFGNNCRPYKCNQIQK